MPEEIIPTPAPELEKTAELNAEIAVKQAAQDLSGHSTAAEENAATSDALDALLAAKVEPKTETDDAPAVETVKPAVVPAKPDATPAVVPAKPDATVPAVVDPDTEARQKKAEDIFKDTPGLPPGASPKSSEAFAAVKIRAAQELASAHKSIDDLKAEKAALEEKLKTPIPAELEEELKGHREWRAKLDVDADPKFKTFDASIASSREFIYAQLKRSPAVSDETIAQIKKHGGPEMVNMEKVYEATKDPALQRIIDSRIAEIEQTKWQKEEAVKTTKANIAAYVEERRKAMETAPTAHNEETAKIFEGYANRLEWLHEKTVDPKSDKATQDEVAAHNKFVESTRDQLTKAYVDDSPKMRAILLTAMAQYLNNEREYQKLKTQSAATEASLKAELQTATDAIARFKKASTSRLSGSGAPPGGRTADQQSKPGDIFTTRPADALDSIAKDIIEKKALAAAK